MNIKLSTNHKLQKKNIVILCSNNTDWEKLNLFSKRELSYIKQQIEFKVNIFTIPHGNDISIIHYIPTGDGTRNKKLEKYRRAGNSLFKMFNSLKTKDIQFLCDIEWAFGAAYLEGLLLSSYNFNNYKTNKKECSDININVISTKKDEIHSVKQIEDISKGVCFARDLVNMPLSHLTAEKMAQLAEEKGKETGYTTEILNQKKLESLKMGGILAVNKGSVLPATFSILEWKPKNTKNDQPIVLVGKGVVYDTGGLSLKPTTNSMDFMKSDMGGAAAVIGTMEAISRIKLNLHVIALIPACENRPGGDAYVPGDVITMYSGNTVEVLNTDAEGRMLLADALHYAKKFNPKLVIDLATLTGAAARAFGPQAVAMMGNADDTTKNKLKTAGLQVHERAVELPLYDEYFDSIKSDIADVKNVGGAYAGAITAGKFLEYFTDYPWIHIDIAGMAYLKQPDGYRSKNGTGVGVRLMTKFLQSLAEKK